MKNIFLKVFNFTGCKNTKQKNCKHDWFIKVSGNAEDLLFEVKEK